MTERQGYSGRLLLRMPRTLHAELARAAEREGTSLNQLIVGLLSRSVGGPGAEPAGERTLAEPTLDGVGPAARESRTLRIALAINLVVVLLAGAIAIALLIVAWRGGF